MRMRKHGLHYRQAKFPQLEKVIKTWIVDQQSIGYTVSIKIKICKAKRLAAEENTMANEFTGSSSWCYCFMKWHNLSMRVKTQIAQKLPEE